MLKKLIEASEGIEPSHCGFADHYVPTSPTYRLTDYAPSVRVVRLIVVQSPSVLVNRSPTLSRIAPILKPRAGFCKVYSSIPSTCRGCRGTRNLCLCPTKLTDLVNTQPVYYLDSLSATAP